MRLGRVSREVALAAAAAGAAAGVAVALAAGAVVAAAATGDISAESKPTFCNPASWWLTMPDHLTKSGH
jgi:hypothetical protein